MEGHQNNETLKKKKKRRNESVACCESPPSKKRKELKAFTNNELECMQRTNTEKDVTNDSDVENNKKCKELVKKRKSKEKEKIKHSTSNFDQMESMRGQKQDEVDIKMESDVESEGLVKKKKKKHKDKHNMSDNVKKMPRRKQEEADVTMEPAVESSNTIQVLRKKKKKSKKKHNLEDESFTNDEMEFMQRKRTADVLMNPELERSNRSEDLVKKKKLEEKSNTKVKRNKNVETVHRRQETQNEDLRSPSRDVNIGVMKKRSSKGEHLEDDDVLLEQIKEFVPNIESKEPINVGKLIKYDLPRYEEFKRQGIPIRIGRFTTEENARLRKNVEDFLALTGVDNATKLFFTFRFKDEEEHIKRLKKQHRFFKRIAEGIPRSCYYIYSRGRKMFDDQQYKGEFSKDELHNLLKLHTLHGSNWKKISELTDRSAFSLQKRFAQLSKKNGSWSKNEVQRLLKAVHDYIVSQLPRTANGNAPVHVSKDTLHRRLPWQDIAAKVKTRSWSKCREKWMFYLASKMSSGSIFTEKKALDVKIKLIKAMYETEVEDVTMVDWEEMADVIGDVPPAYVQRKWHRIKVSHVPEWQTKCFADIVDFLYEKVLPHLEQKFSGYRDCTDIQESHESFLFTDIFQDCNGEQNNDDSDED